MKDNIWKISEAKNHFCKIIKLAMDHQPQVITKRGRKVVVICSVEDYEKKGTSEKNFLDFFRQKPYFDDRMNLKRSKDLPRYQSPM